jgi:predicted AAA+ superfamily ATPase
MYLREQIFRDSGEESLFLWGARQTGKSTLLKIRYPDALYIDLLRSDEFLRFSSSPSRLREVTEASVAKGPVIIDEIQKIPELLDEVHWLIANRNRKFILSGSSPRKILRKGVNLLGGRAIRYELFPLVSREIPDFDLIRALNRGLIPRHYTSNSYKKLTEAYIGSYLQDEIMAEARIRNISAFSRFLEAAAFSNGEMVNYSNIAADCGVSSVTVRDYFQILTDTLTGRFIPVYQRKPKRRVILAPRFWFFDIGIANTLLKRGKIEAGNEAFGKAFEHFICNELVAHSHYSGLNYNISYWRTASQLEVDFILGENDAAIEVKSTANVTERDLRGLKAFLEEYSVKHAIVVSNDPQPRKSGKIRILPWKNFLDELWEGNIII